MAKRTQCPYCHSLRVEKSICRRRGYYCHACSKYFITERRPLVRKNFQFNDANETASGISDRKNCAVIATAIALGIAYQDAHALLELAGRTHRQGTRVFEMDKAYRMAGELGYGKVRRLNIEGRAVTATSYDSGKSWEKPIFTSEELRLPQVVERKWTDRYGYSRVTRNTHRPVTLAMLRSRLGQGKYIVCNRNHAFAMIDGVVNSTHFTGPSAVVTQVWRVE